MIEILKSLIRRFEGLSLSAYPDPASGGEPVTIGYGHTGGVKMDDKISKQTAEFLMEQDADSSAMKALTLSPSLLDSPGAHAAIADFIFNLGSARYKASTLRRKINSGDTAGAKQEIVKWVFGGGRKMPGLIARRKAESDLL